ncbi:protein phosphatase 2C domain-containing protein [Angustibacter peucedani]
MTASPLEMAVGAATDVGHRRRRNEDCVLAEGSVYVVADGMGGHAAGDVASRLVVEAFRELAPREDLRAADVLAALRTANADMLSSSARHPEQSGMGTTASGLVVVQAGGSPHWAVFNVGDSRVYRYVDGDLHQVSVDHSEVQELVDAGMLSPAEARAYPRRNVVTRSLGHDPMPQVDLWVVPQQPGERFVVCSDGLTDEVEDDVIAAVLADDDEPQRTAERLVEAALEAGGRDNVTAIVVALSRGAGVADVDEDTSPRGQLTGAGG